MIPARLWQPEKLWRVEVSNWRLYRDGEGGFEWVSDAVGPTTWAFAHRVGAVAFAARFGITLS